jgi:hypothetical protein
MLKYGNLVKKFNGFMLLTYTEVMFIGLMTFFMVWLLIKLSTLNKN